MLQQCKRHDIFEISRNIQDNMFINPQYCSLRLGIQTTPESYIRTIYHDMSSFLLVLFYYYY